MAWAPCKGRAVIEDTLWRRLFSHDLKNALEVTRLLQDVAIIGNHQARCNQSGDAKAKTDWAPLPRKNDENANYHYNK